MKWKTMVCGAALMVALNACAQTPSAAPSPQPTIVLSPAPMTPTSIAPTATTAVKIKRNNLLFVEFFGIT